MTQRLASARELRTRLADLPVPGSFSDVELEGLPDPVRRHFKEAIAPGTPLATSARFRMHGSIKLGRRWYRSVPGRFSLPTTDSCGPLGRAE